MSVLTDKGHQRFPSGSGRNCPAVSSNGGGGGAALALVVPRASATFIGALPIDLTPLFSLPLLPFPSLAPQFPLGCRFCRLRLVLHVMGYSGGGGGGFLLEAVIENWHRHQLEPPQEAPILRPREQDKEKGADVTPWLEWGGVLQIRVRWRGVAPLLLPWPVLSQATSFLKLALGE